MLLISAFFIFYIIMMLITSKSFIHSDYGNRIQHEVLLANDESNNPTHHLMEFVVVISLLWYFYWIMYLLDKFIDYRINKTTERKLK